MIHRLLRSATLALAVYSGSTVAGPLDPLPFPDSVLRDYVAHRWLYGSSSELAKTLEYRVYQIPVYGMQLGGNRVHTRERNTQTVNAFRAYARDHGAKEAGDAEVAKQFELWTDCLVKSYHAELEPGDIDTLQRFVKSGVVHIVPQLSRAFQDWQLVVIQQAMEVRDKSSPSPNTSLEPADSASLRTALAIADPIDEKYMIYFGLFSNEAFRERYKSAFGGELSALASPLGVDAPSWAQLRAYASSDLYMKERAMHRKCESNPSYISPPINEWFSSVSKVMVRYFEENKASFVQN
jgi:hypothetical protein